ncbi:uncharacterized protein BRPE67_CCDS10570 [Caballeronia cordobensis]|nr:uncharacterized protein BRPE67_CCDS10570 [Burkholderia sp. RPE67]
MCYGNPNQLLMDLLQARPPARDARGYTALDDFNHFCAYSGCDPKNAWAKYAYLSARLPPATA